MNEPVLKVEDGVTYKGYAIKNKVHVLEFSKESVFNQYGTTHSRSIVCFWECQCCKMRGNAHSRGRIIHADNCETEMQWSLNNL